ncbi:MAG: exo-beta-1,3-glucanase [Methylovulum sp.]|nr:exo-beta-1,3-glucanase [Methylovulum sp.]
MCAFTKQLLSLIILLLLSAHGQNAFADKQAALEKAPHAALQCVAFSPYVGKLTPDYGAPPSKELIGTLLDKLIKDTPFRCIMTYGVINGLDNIFPAAEARHLKVIAILWIDKDATVNSQSISRGIYLAKTFKDTIIKLSCGSEVRTRHGYAFDSEVSRCIQAMREAKVSQPVTTIDTWWEWCNRSSPCGQTSFSTQVDWIGINIFPWWENRYSDIHTCTTGKQAADFHIAQLEKVQNANPGKDVIITEFGWPNGPDNSTEINGKTGQLCGIAGPKNQAAVVESTFKRLAQKNRSGVVFEAFSEDWKPGNEGNFGRYWGLCKGEPPYTCNKELNFHQ